MSTATSLNYLENNMATMYLIRHGATLQNESQPIILQGNGLNGPLSDKGRRQASEVAELLSTRKLAAIYASPMLRAQQTALCIAQHHDLSVETVDELHEVNVGHWEGKSWQQIMDEEPDAYNRFMNDSTFPYRGGESFQNVLDRVAPQFAQLLQRHAGEPFAVIAHNVVNRVYLAELLGRGLESCRHIRQMNCCVNYVRQQKETPELICINSVFHLSDW